MNQIDLLREKQNKSYASIAKETGLSPTYIYLLAKGKRRNPSLEVMQKISSSLGRKVEDVFNLQDKN